MACVFWYDLWYGSDCYLLQDLRVTGMTDGRCQISESLFLPSCHASAYGVDDIIGTTLFT